MGRHKRLVPSGRLRLKTTVKCDDPDNYLYTLNYEYTWMNSAPIRKQTGIKARKSDFDAQKQELKSSYGRNYKIINSQLKAQLSHYDALLLDYQSKNPNGINPKVIRSILFDNPINRKDKGKDFVEYVLADLHSRANSNKIGASRLENGISVMRKFKIFLETEHLGTYKPDSIYLGEISREIIDRYISYMRDNPSRKNSDATINHSLTPIIIACDRAKDEGLLDPVVAKAIKDCRVVETPLLDEQPLDNKFLTKEELNKLVEFYKNDTEARRKEYLEMYFFALHAGGMRLVDVMSLMWHSESRPFTLDYTLMEEAGWLHDILETENITAPVLVGQSMGGYVAQCFMELYPGECCGFISIDSAPLKRRYVTSAEIWMLRNCEWMYRLFPWRLLVKSGSYGCAQTEYGRSLMKVMMLTYSHDEYCSLAGHGYRILADAMAADLPYAIDCPALLICGEKDRAAAAMRYNRAWAATEGLPIFWVPDAGHNSNTDCPDLVNRKIEEFIGGILS